MSPLFGLSTTTTFVACQAENDHKVLLYDDLITTELIILALGYNL